ncbi:FecCD family ABC transporter permease [Paenibacillus eucommiae]|uniref:Iron complex transport system permease protein n=1 Tax=Paenibacillus eucommiae TaxID=1355755 RepID=A0ABS4IQA7_9BACL|nr:iron ABC transporter permease [Paenibacillus eucommiae]MBP1989747.1 iron complex transport system permease protein [Paenibacillus eucommiae]
MSSIQKRGAFTGMSTHFESVLKRRSLFIWMMISLIAAVICSIGMALSIGQVAVPFMDSLRIIVYQTIGLSLGDMNELSSGSVVDIIWHIRFPRVLLAMIVGIGLALCGTVMQASVQNPLADPYLLGISSGASLGATFSIMLGFGAVGIMASLGVAFWAFIGALGAAALVLVLANLGGKMSSVKLVLAGTIINALCSAFSNLIVYLAKNAEGIRSVTFWSMGSLASAKWDKLPLIAIMIGLAALFFICQARVLNTMLMGDETAVTLGINLNFYRRLYMIISSVLTGVIVATCGIIGFVGLIVPHIVRGMVGPDHKRLLPVVILTSAIFMIWTDVLARTIIPNGELPIGIVTALLGAPMFMYMLMKKSYGFGGK